jgi:hypothetical protein
MQRALTQFQLPSHPKHIQLRCTGAGLVPFSATSHGEQLFESNTNADNWTYLPYAKLINEPLGLQSWLPQGGVKMQCVEPAEPPRGPTTGFFIRRHLSAGGDSQKKKPRPLLFALDDDLI